MAELKFNFLKDEPLDKGGANFFNFYHEIIAPALLQILENETTPHTIGLFGSWGTGKSTIIKMLKSDPKLKAPVFVFDAWKYQADALRRTFLIKLAEFVQDEERIKLDDNILKPLYVSTSSAIMTHTKPAETLTKGQRILLSIKQKALPLLAIVTLGTWILLNIFARKSDFAVIIRQLAGTISGISFAVLILKPSVETIVKALVEKLFSSLKMESEARTQTDFEDKLNSPEQFEEKFKQIISQVNKKMVIVFDNVDRVPGDVAISMLSTIKTFMEPSKDNSLVFIVPCDVDAIEGQLTKYYDKEGAVSNITPSDYLRKVFNLVVWVPEFVSADLEQYTKQCLSLTGDIKKLVNNEDVVLVITAAFSKNPREIIQFVNNLVALTVAAQGTNVSTTINDNIAYLAKVLVLKQKFPKAYKRLQENWYRPEEITDSTAVDEIELSNFMNLTSRITVEDAEPFIYFKNPDGSRGLKESGDLKAALVGANLEAAIKATNAETDKDAIVDFVTDLVIKHKGQDKALFNIFVTQLELLKELGIVPQQKRYYDNMIGTLDTQLWRDYRKLPTNSVFTILSDQHATAKLRSAVLERYVLAFSGKDIGESQKDFDISTLENLREQSKLLSVEQRTKVRAAIDEKYGTDEAILSMFNGLTEQERFIATTTIKKYMATIDRANIAKRLTTLKQYKDYIIKQGELGALVSKVAEILSSENATDPAYSESKAEVIGTLRTLYETFNNELKETKEPMAELANALVAAYSGNGVWENGMLIANELWRFMFHIPKPPQQEAISRVRSYFTTAPPEGIVTMLNYWESESRASSLIHNVMEALSPRLLTDEKLLLRAYELAADVEKREIITYVIQNTPVDDTYDINFIKQIGKLPDRPEVLKELLIRVGAFTYLRKSAHYEYLATELKKNDPRVIRQMALDQAKTLLESDEADVATVGLNFLQSAKFLTISDRRETAKELLAWLREPGRIIDYRHNPALSIITAAFDDLQQTPQAELLYTIFSLLDEGSSRTTLEVALQKLSEISPKYADYEKDYEDLLSRLENWQDGDTKSLVIQGMLALQPAKENTKEKKFWARVKATTTVQES